MGPGVTLVVLGAVVLWSWLFGRNQAGTTYQNGNGNGAGGTQGRTPEGSALGTANGQGDPTVADGNTATSPRPDVEAELYYYTAKDYGVAQGLAPGVIRGSMAETASETQGQPFGPNSLDTDRANLGGGPVE